MKLSDFILSIGGYGAHKEFCETSGLLPQTWQKIYYATRDTGRCPDIRLSTMRKIVAASGGKISRLDDLGE